MIGDIPYPFTVRPLTEDDGGGYLVEFPDLPGCMSDGETIEEAIVNAEDAMRGWIEAMREAGRVIPAPSAGRRAIARRKIVLQIGRSSSCHRTAWSWGPGRPCWKATNLLWIYP